MTRTASPAPPYAALAAGYDVVMEHVDYDDWAEYVMALLARHHPQARRLLELGCGTGSLAFALQPRGGFDYLATDGQPAMIRVARRKAEWFGGAVQFDVADFTNYRLSEPVDAALLLYDGMNYLLEPDDIRALLRCTEAALVPGGVFLLDQSTPANSINNEEAFEDEGEAEGFAYVRHSRYDPHTRLHTTTFELTYEGQAYTETHVQRAYDAAEIRAVIRETSFRVEAAYDGFSLDPADDGSERIQWVLRKPG